MRFRAVMRFEGCRRVKPGMAHHRTGIPDHDRVHARQATGLVHDVLHVRLRVGVDQALGDGRLAAPPAIVGRARVSLRSSWLVLLPATRTARVQRTRRPRSKPAASPCLCSSILATQASLPAREGPARVGSLVWLCSCAASGSGRPGDASTRTMANSTRCISDGWNLARMA